METTRLIGCRCKCSDTLSQAILIGRKFLNIFIYDNRNGVGKNCIYDPVMYDRSLDLLAQYENLEFVERMKTTYMNQVYDPDKIKKTSYYKEIEEITVRDFYQQMVDQKDALKP